MKDFKSYAQGGEPPESNNNQGGADGKTEAQLNNAVELINALTKAFGGKSEGEIWKTILSQAEQGKKNGTLTNADLDNFYATLAPLLDGFRRQKLKSVISKLKAI